ncbi:MAG: HlyU family transcriptional regulator [Gammaproteobacteria bacterium]|nr:HlyU family transcriptional regulator [Gammaproteobacteria bacterium]
MIRFLKKHPGAGARTGATAKPAREEPAEANAGISISPCPRSVGGGWSTEAVIRKTVDGEARQHAFIRADTSPTREAAAALAISKARTLIDQQGDEIFS